MNSVILRVQQVRTLVYAGALGAAMVLLAGCETNGDDDWFDDNGSREPLYDDGSTGSAALGDEVMHEEDRRRDGRGLNGDRSRGGNLGGTGDRP